jgi:hypothetical protein
MFRFTTRELVLLTGIVALALGWWLDRSRLAKQILQPRPPEERYELVKTGKDGEKLYLFNRRTGEMWERYSDGPGGGGKWWRYTASVENSKHR